MALVICRLQLNHPWEDLITHSCVSGVMSRTGVDTDGLSQQRLLMLHAGGPPVCLCSLIFPAGFSFKALRWAFKRLLRRRWRPPSDFPSLSPPVHCPFQWLIYGPHKCARDAEISEEVINRTKPRKRGGKRKQTEELTGTCGVKGRAWDRHREREPLTVFQSVLL